MENQTITLAGISPTASSSGSGGPSGGGPSHSAASSTTARRRTPGRWRRIPRVASASQPPSQPRLVPSQPHLVDFIKPGLGAQAEKRDLMVLIEEGKQKMLGWAKELENTADDQPCLSEEAQAEWRHFKNTVPGHIRWLADGNVTFRPTPPPSDTHEEDLSAEQMEEFLARHEICPQARHFATLALKHYNSKRVHKFEMATVLLSKCFTEHYGVTYGHVNFTAAPEGQVTSLAAKRLFFAALMLVPELQMNETAEPMRVVHVCTIDGSCYGGCHLIKREIKKSIRNKMDYDRCHACSDRIKHPKGDQFIGGHNSTRMPYYSVFPCVNKKELHLCGRNHMDGSKFEDSWESRGVISRRFER